MFKKNRGFTLIELLAVIVILSIIMVIAIPQILGVIEQSKISAAKSSALGYIKAIDYNNKLSQMGQGEYQLITSGNVSNIDVKISGNAPSFGTVAVNENGKVSTAILCVIDHLVIYDGLNVTVEDKCNGDSSTASEIRTCEQFATDSWITIALNKYQVGCEKELVLDINDNGENETYHIQTINNTTSSDCLDNDFSQSACGMVYQFKELLNIKNADDKKMNLNSTNVGGWPASKMYTYLNTTLYNKLPNDLKMMIKTTKVISGHGKNDGEENFVSYDKLYLLSTTEVEGTGNSYDTAKLTTRIMDYYKKTLKNREKYNYGTQSPRQPWWLRSAQPNHTEAFVNTYGGSYGGSYSYATFGVAPAFKLGLN